MLSSYSDINYILSLDIEDFVELVIKAYDRQGDKNERELDTFLLHMWGYDLPHLSKYINFQEYRNIALDIKPKVNIVTKKNNNKLTNEELIKEVEILKNIDQNK